MPAGLIQINAARKIWANKGRQSAFSPQGAGSLPGETAIGVVITLIVDLDRPQTGLITVSQQPLLDVLERIK